MGLRRCGVIFRSLPSLSPKLKLYDEESSNKDDDFVLKLFPKLQSHLHLHRIGYAQTELLRGGALPMDTVESLMPNLGQLNLPIYAMFLKDGLTNTVLSDKVTLFCIHVPRFTFCHIFILL